jgi:ParB/RepB/Spo0J family partition protein
VLPEDHAEHEKETCPGEQPSGDFRRGRTPTSRGGAATRTEPLAGKESADISRREIPDDGFTKVLSSGRTRRFEEVSMNLIDPDPEQVRVSKGLETEAFTEMCSNVRQYGVLQPVLVQPSSRPGRYTLISGEYRYEAARKAGLRSLPCYIEEALLDPAAVLLRQLSENLHRRAISHLDLARAFHRLTLPAKEGGCGLTAKELARLLGKSNAFVSEHKVVLRLSPEDQQKLEDGTMSFDQARLKVRRRYRHHPTDADIPTPDETGPDTKAEGHAGETSSRRQRDGSPACRRERLSNGDYIFQEYSGRYLRTTLSVLVAGAEETGPDLDRVVLAVTRHLHFLKLLQQRKGQEGARET